MKRILTKLVLGAAITSIATSAIALEWGAFKDDGCVGTDLRAYSSVLWNIPFGANWEQTCAATPARVPTAVGPLDFDHPTMCVKATIAEAVGLVGLLVGIPGIAYPAVGAVGVVIGAVSMILDRGGIGALNMWGVFYVQDPGNC